LRIAGPVGRLEGIKIDLGHGLPISKQPWRLEGAFDREIEKRTDQVIVLLEESDRRMVAEA
ncbi:MAG: hypothetical protein QOF05_468, partial [Sphingomonadales bacterium]|nr:hypothetical protein [Sphingomonadales bacterium]